MSENCTDQETHPAVIAGALDLNLVDGSAIGEAWAAATVSFAEAVEAIQSFYAAFRDDARDEGAAA